LGVCRKMEFRMEEGTEGGCFLDSEFARRCDFLHQHHHQLALNSFYENEKIEQRKIIIIIITAVSVDVTIMGRG
jgi:hypothetical protein